MSRKRIHYIDWLRVIAVLLLFPFHTARVFDLGDPFYAKSAHLSVPLTMMIAFIDRWHMPLLFMLAGMSTYFALRHRTIGQYAGERAKRLLVPLVFGTLLIVPPQTWYGARTNDGYTGSFIDYVTSNRLWSAENLLGRGDYFGGITPAHLWFIMFLWMLSMLALPLLAWGRTERGAASLQRWARRLSKPWWWLVVLIFVFIGEALPDVGVNNPLYYFVFFVSGYVIMHDEAFAIAAERLRIPTLVAGFLINIFTLAMWRFGDSLPDSTPQRGAWVYLVLLGGWLSMVGLIGFGRRYLDRPSQALSYLAEASYPIYILHQTVIVVLGFYIARMIPSATVAWPFLLAASLVVTFGLYEIVRRVNVLRFLMGLRPCPSSEPASSRA